MTALSNLRTGRAGRARHAQARHVQARRGWLAACRVEPPAQLNWTIAVLVPVASFLLASVDPRLRHWCLIPITACGVLVTVDAVEWFRRRTDVFDPRAVIGLFGVHYFYVAPLLHVAMDYWAPEGVAPADWRNALGSLAVVNAVGLLIYRIILAGSERAPAGLPRPRPLDERVFHGVGRVALVVGLCAFLGEVMLFGGVEGFLRTVSRGAAAVDGLGWLLVPADSFPLIGFVLVVVRWRAVLARRRGLLGLLLAGMVVTQFVVAGLRGSRTSTIWPVLVAVIVVHLLVTPVTRRALAVSALVFGLFLYGYGLYKGSGLGVLDLVRGERSVAEVSDESGRDLPLVLLGDLGRADINARMLERVRTGAAPPAFGETYAGGLGFLAPSFLVPEKPRDKVAVGTDMIYGPGSYDSGKRSARAYGITGEGIMNFGVIGGLLSFAGLAFAVRYVRRFHLRARRAPDLVTVLLAPSLLLLTVNLLLWDFGNLAWFLLKHVSPLALVVVVALWQSRTCEHGSLNRLGRRLATMGTPGGVAHWWARTVGQITSRSEARCEASRGPAASA